MKIWLSSLIGGALLMSLPVYAASQRAYDPYYDFDNPPKPSASPAQTAPSYTPPASTKAATPSYNTQTSRPSTPTASQDAEFLGIQKQRPSSPAVQGQIQQTQQTEPNQPIFKNPNAPAQYSAAPQGNLSAESYIQVSQVDIPLEGRLKKKFQGLKITLKNKQGNYIEIVRGDIVNGVDGQTAYQMTDNSRARGLWSSLATTPLNYVPYGGYGSGAVSTAANAAGGASDQNTANSAYNKVKSFPNGVLSPNDEVSIYTLVPTNERPQVKIIFKDLKTNEMFTLSQ